MRSRRRLNDLSRLLRDDSQGWWILMGICLHRLNDPSRLLRVRDGRQGFLLRRIVGRRGFQRREDNLDFLWLDLRRLRGVLRLRRFIRIRRLLGRRQRRWGVWVRRVWRLRDDRVGRRMGWGWGV
jgi:hypothetical protein